MGFAQRVDLDWIWTVLRTGCRGKQEQKEGGGPVVARREGWGPGWSGQWRREKLEPQDARVDWR